MNVSDIIDLDIIDVAYRGKGIAKYAGAVIFVPRTITGERVRCKITAAKKRFYEAEPLEILSPSPERIVPCCRLPDGSPVPGCEYDHMAYDAEVRIKDSQLRNFLRKLVPDPANIILAPFASPSPLHYRNKIVFHAERREGDQEARIGYLGDDNKSVTDIASCPLAHPAINFAWSTLRATAKLKLRDGDSITFRRTANDGVVNWINRAPEDAAWLTEDTSIGSIIVPPDGFFQVNPEVAAELVRTVIDWVSSSSSERILDLYCGVGMFGLAAAKAGFKEIIGIESGRNAVSAARRNAKTLGVANARFYCETTASAAKSHFHCSDFANTTAIIDPPRAGMENGAAEVLASKGIKTIVYVSCDPATLTRDLGIFAKSGYSIKLARVFDMFPRTVHFESAVLLCKT